MKAFKCEYCGGNINHNTLKCEYCGTQYKRDFADGPVHRLVVEHHREEVKVLGASIGVSEFTLREVPPEKVAEYTIKEIARSLADALVPYIELETMRHPEMATQIIKGKVRVVEPHFRF